MSIAAVILAAGAGTRWTGSGHKLLADFRGRPLVSWCIEAADAAGLDELIVVGGAVDLSGLMPAGATLLTNDDWASGQAGSVQVALAHSTRVGHDAVVLGLADTPMVPTSAWLAVADDPGDLVTATFDRERRPPVKVAKSLWPELPVSGDGGARSLLASRSSSVVEVACEGLAIDIDTLEDLEKWS
ncbi:MAG: NTP transferase domain-containing protein [Acidimicrobiia bacterium]|nr:NTP transferase domain-containing protein [Actinomycetota bacterium]MBL6925393.1 NTP transferase domain-containing protein [Acidimicrobiia bacterium]MBL6927467.1 NTP transferase domain-containing protein [Acidimicrobiia bacterium]